MASWLAVRPLPSYLRAAVTSSLDFFVKPATLCGMEFAILFSPPFLVSSFLASCWAV